MTRHEKDSRDLPDAGGLTLTTEDIIDVMEEEIELNGLEKAKEYFSVMTHLFSRKKGWSAVERAVLNLFKREKKRQEEQEASRVANMNGKNVTYMENHGTMQFSYNNH